MHRYHQIETTYRHYYRIATTVNDHTLVAAIWISDTYCEWYALQLHEDQIIARMYTYKCRVPHMQIKCCALHGHADCTT